MIKNKIKTLYSTIFSEYFKTLENELSDCNEVLDVGCGHNSPIQFVNVDFSVGIELYKPYIQKSKDKKIHDYYINEDIKDYEFKANSFDAVLCIDVIEHFEKEKGYELIKRMEKWARKKVIIITPNGYIKQDSYDDNYLQKHESGWTVEDFKKLGFKTYGLSGWKALRGYKADLKYKPYFFWTIISDITEKLLYKSPKYSFYIFAVKKLN
jgi:SAM-dependent methyltransferase